MPRDFKLPDLGEGIAEGQIVRVLVKDGQNIAEDQALMEVETDKAAVEIPSPFAGVAQKVHVKEGDTVKVGQVLVTFDGNGQAGGDKSKTAAKAEPAPAREAAKAAPAPADDRESDRHERTAVKVRPTEPASGAAPESLDSGSRSRAAAAPAVRKLARELGVDIDSLAGTGPGGRVLREDVESAAKGPAAPPAPAGGQALLGRPAAPLAPAAQPAFAPPVIEGTPGKDNWGTTRRAKLTQIRKTIAAQMTKAAAIPSVTHTDEVDVSILDRLRRELRGEDGKGPRVTLISFVIKALAHCLRAHPVFNAAFDAQAEEIVYKEYVNIGIAVDSPRGLVVPVIRNVDRLSVLGIAQETTRLAERVRNVQFAVDDLRGGTFTVTNYGAIGGIWGTPVINAPEVGILGLGRVTPQLRPSADEEDTLELRSILPLSLTFDHRAADGAQAARFLNDVVAHLAHPSLMLIK